MAAYVPYTWSTGDSITAARLNNLETQYACAMSMVGPTLHPVGSLRFTTVNTNPGSYLGGTWSAWGTGRVMVAVDVGQTEFDVAEETGGAKNHTLTISEMPAHRHDIRGNPGGTGSGGNAIGAALDNTQTITGTDNTVNTGGGASHNNLQPYITGYMWKRVA